MRHALLAAFIVVAVVRSAAAQSPPAVRPLGRVERVSADSLASVAAALPMSDGRVLVNDLTARRVLLVDSTLAHARVIADTTSVTADAYGQTPGTLIRYRGDSVLFIDVSSLSMLVLGPSGAIARVMAIPRPNDAAGLIGGLYGTPGVDARGRLVYYSGAPTGSIQILRRGARAFADDREGAATVTTKEIDEHIDSAVIVRVDPATRVVDTLASFKITKFHRVTKTDDHGVILAFEWIPDPLPLVDDWAMMPDGTLAVVRGRDFHVDWISADGHRSSSAKMPFTWQRVDDQRKQTLIDSATVAVQQRLDGIVGGAFAGGGSGSRGRGGIGAPAAATPPSDAVPNVARRPGLNDLPDYMPAFAPGAAHADADGNLWIRTTAVVGGQPVYDIVNRRGELVDRVQLPSFRTIAGFGPGVVYLAMKDAAGVVHLERSRIK
jgi:hypothetical protein